MADRYNRPQVAIVEAESPEDALELLKHGLGDHSGVKNHAYDPVIECVPPTSKGRIITLALKRYGEVGRNAQVLLKYVIQQAIELRVDMGGTNARPVFIWAAHFRQCRAVNRPRRFLETICFDNRIFLSHF